MRIDLKSIFEKKQNLNCENLTVTSVTSVTNLENQGLAVVTDDKTKTVTSVTTKNQNCYHENKQNQDIGEMVTVVTAVTPKKTQNQFLDFRPKDWLCYYDERAAIYEYENGDTRTEAENGAFDDCLEKYLEAYKAETGAAINTLMSFGLHNPFYKY